jgi:membrane dipeptidase
MVNFYNAYVHPVDAKRSTKYYSLQSELTEQFPDDQERVDAELKKWLTANPRSNLCTVHHVLDHIDHIVDLVGVDHAGLGSDFDGVPSLPKQLEDVSAYPVITQGLIDRGYSESDIRKVLGENLMRIFRQAERVAESSKN